MRAELFTVAYLIHVRGLPYFLSRIFLFAVNLSKFPSLKKYQKDIFDFPKVYLLRQMKWNVQTTTIHHIHCNNFMHICTRNFGDGLTSCSNKDVDRLKWLSAG